MILLDSGVHNITEHIDYKHLHKQRKNTNEGYV